jgi:hypothetical protein
MSNTIETTPKEIKQPLTFKEKIMKCHEFCAENVICVEYTITKSQGKSILIEDELCLEWEQPETEDGDIDHYECNLCDDSFNSSKKALDHILNVHWMPEFHEILQEPEQVDLEEEEEENEE